MEKYNIVNCINKEEKDNKKLYKNIGRKNKLLKVI